MNGSERLVTVNVNVKCTVCVCWFARTTTYTLLLPVAFDRKLVSKDGECSGLFVCLLCG